MRKLNLGIVAHVDAGKTSLTERLLFDAGAIDRLGSVDDGSTQTDGMDLERRRGITIRSAVAVFGTADREVHLIDTPGHADFVAEVERALGVLDGAILVLSAVEGVQAHTCALMRTLKSLAVPTILFINKIDRLGARDTDLMADIRRLLTPSAVAVNWSSRIGTRDVSVADVEPELAELLAEHSDEVLESYLDGVDPGLLRAELVRQTGKALVHPVFFGSAITGAGMDALRSGLVDLLPSTDPSDPALAEPLDGTVFAVERDKTGRRFAVARLFSGSLAAREQVTSGTQEGRATSVLDVHGRETRVQAGGIARIAGLPKLRIGDRLGSRENPPPPAWFRPPTLETVVTSTSPGLFDGLSQLADQDPLINVRRGPAAGSLIVSLYGEVQQEVIAARLAEEFGVQAEFSAPRMICVERLASTGSAFTHISETRYAATIGLRIDPGPPDSGVRFQLEAERGSLPAAFITAIEDTVRLTLGERRVVDCVVTLTHTGYSSPVSVAADFRGLTPEVLTTALRQAGTVVCEPLDRVDMDIPETAVSAVMALLVHCDGTPGMSVIHGDSATVEAVVPSARLREVERALPGSTGGYGVLTSRFAGYRPIREHNRHMSSTSDA